MHKSERHQDICAPDPLEQEAERYAIQGRPGDDGRARQSRHFYPFVVVRIARPRLLPARLDRLARLLRNSALKSASEI